MKCSCKTFFLSHPFKDILRSLLVSSAGHLQVFLRPVYHLHSQLWGCRVAMTMYTSRLPRMHWGDFGHHKGPQVVIEYGAQGCGVTLGVLGLEHFSLVPPLALSLRAVLLLPWCLWLWIFLVRHLGSLGCFLAIVGLLCSFLRL